MKCTFLLFLLIMINSIYPSNQENTFKKDYEDKYYYPEVTDFADTVEV